MASITASGIASGLDVSSIVSQLMNIERQPLSTLQKEQSSISAKISSFGKIQSALSALKDKAGAFGSTSTSSSTSVWGQTSTTVSDASVATVTSISGKSAATGSYSLQVNALATTQALSSSAFAASSSTLSEGSLTIELGAWTGGSPSTGFNPKTGTTPVTISVGAEETSLSSIRDKINMANAGVTAGIVTDASGSRLTLKSSATGAENAFRITASETSDDGVAGTGLSALTYDAGTSSPMARNQSAGNASILIDGLAISSASNTIDNAVEGLSIKLGKVSAAPVDLAVSTDNAALKTVFNEFVSAFNSLANVIKTETKYDAASKTAGKLQADRTATGVQGAIRQLVFEKFPPASGSFKSFSDIGITFNSSGNLQINSSKLDSALLDPAAVKSLLTGGAGASTEATGLMNRFKKYADTVLVGDGALQSRTDGLNTQLKRNGERQDAVNTRLVAVEDRLKKQYQTLDKKLSSLSSMSSAVSNMSIISYYR
jgi:flagellar hook-associated protein 2